MARTATEEEIERFRRDLARLKKKHGNDKVAERLGIDPANLSSYSTTRNPGKKTINKLYMSFNHELNEAGKPADENAKLPEVEEPLTRYGSRHGRDEYVEELRDNYSHAQRSMDKMLELTRAMVDHADKAIATHGRMVESQVLIAESNNNMSKSSLVVAETNRDLVNRLLRKPYSTKRLSDNPE